MPMANWSKESGRDSLALGEASGLQAPSRNRQRAARRSSAPTPADGWNWRLDDEARAMKRWDELTAQRHQEPRPKPVRPTWLKGPITVPTFQPAAVRTHSSLSAGSGAAQVQRELRNFCIAVSVFDALWLCSDLFPWAIYLLLWLPRTLYIAACQL